MLAPAWRGTSMVLVVLVAAAACAKTHPPELLYASKYDRDAELCRNAEGESAIDACRRVVERASPFRWPGWPAGAAFVYVLRGSHAIVLAQRLVRADRVAEALDAANTALDLLARSRDSFAGNSQDAYARQFAGAWRIQGASAHAVASLSLMRLHRWDEATQRLRQVVSGLPDRAIVWGALGVAANQAGLFEESAAAFAKANELDGAYFSGERRSQRDIWRASQQGRRFEAVTFQDELLL